MANFRPSNILKNIEDGIGFVAGGAARKAGRFGHNVRVEFRARQLANAERAARKLDAKFARMSDDELVATMNDQLEILQRAAELRRGKR